MTAKSLKVAIQMDPMHGINIDGDSTFALALEAQARGHELWHYVVDDMSYEDGRVSAKAHRMIVRREKGNHYSFGDTESLDLAGMDVILMRQDPPFDMAYITASHLLELVQPKTLVVNDPVSVRNAPEKLFVTKFPDLMPPTLITRRLDEVRAFRAKHGEIIVKPLFGNGGAGIFHLKTDDSNLSSLMELFLETSREPVMVQKFLKEVRGGDKRIILIDGEPLGAINRVPAAGEVRSNLVAGGRAEKTELTPREREICDRLGPDLKRLGLIFVGIDVIGGWLTEVNVTSPTGILAANRFNGTKLEADIWNAIEGKVKG